MQPTPTYLHYQCYPYYKLEGPERVYCLANGLWTQVPVCSRESQPPLRCRVAALLRRRAHFLPFLQPTTVP